MKILSFLLTPSSSESYTINSIVYTSYYKSEQKRGLTVRECEKNKDRQNRQNRGNAAGLSYHLSERPAGGGA